MNHHRANFRFSGPAAEPISSAIAMCETSRRFEKPREVIAFQADQDIFGQVNDIENWYVTTDWANRFKSHLDLLLPLAACGNVWAQYCVADLYMTGYLYSSEAECITNQDQDFAEGSKWLELSARQKFIPSLDNLVSIGAGKEAEKLRAIFQEVLRRSIIGTATSGFPVYPANILEDVWQLAYGQDS